MAHDEHGEPTSRWLRGVVESCVLAVLHGGPAYGYDIARRFEQVGFPRPKGGTLYPILARLEAQGLVVPTWIEGDGGPGRKYYQLTSDGDLMARTVMEEWSVFADRVATLMHTADQAVTR